MSKDNHTSELETQLRPEIDRRKSKAEALAAAERERYEEAMHADEAGDHSRATVLLAEVEQLNRRCNQACRAWLKLVVQVLNAKRDGAGGAVDESPPSD